MILHIGVNDYPYWQDNTPVLLDFLNLYVLNLKHLVLSIYYFFTLRECSGLKSFLMEKKD